MNVGDMAIIVKCPKEPANLGLIVEIVKRGVGEFRGWWLVDGNLKQPLPDEIPYYRAWAPAEWLRVLRDPGDDAVDEISLVRRKPEEVTA